ncbi:MAG: DMT family transporter [Rhodocyclaceae bacterium]|nr:DMT family transporter [Rhodocyclaceae bacterium]MCC6878630.1 DMT family transporter [Rhodocyclaceae bacterium]
MLAGATVWGLIWHPYRVLEEMAVPPILAATLTYLVALLLGFPLLRRRLAGARPGGMLLLIALVAGGCNLGYVLATVHGEVMRVLLLFYLAPLWTVLLARLLLQEKVSLPGTAVIALSLAGAVVMLWQPSLGLPLPANGAEWIGLAAGFLFALANVLIRKAHDLSIELKSMAVFAGVALVGLFALPYEPARLAVPPAPAWLLVGVVGLVLLATNLFVQYGLTHTPANRAIVIFLFELVVAALSSWLLAGEAMTPQEWLGGAMIVAASLFSGKLEAREPAPG